VDGDMETNKKLAIIKKHWETSQVESLKDKNLKSLEISAVVLGLKKYLGDKPAKNLADFGCGDGSDTQFFSQFSTNTVGFDYSNEMLSRASEIKRENLSFKQLDLINGNISGEYDIAITKRFIINLGDWPIQSRCMDKIGKAIPSGGLFLMLECFRQGLDNLNCHRGKNGLSPLQEPYHNTYLDFDRTVDYLSKDYSLLETRDFSTYYFLTRCLTPFVMEDKAYDLDEKMRLFAEADNLLQGERIGAQTLLILRKK
jgi:SAM-dependent methyltransferase